MSRCFFNLKLLLRSNLSKRSTKYETLKSKDNQFAAVELPKCLEGPHNTDDRSTKSSRMQH